MADFLSISQEYLAYLFAIILLTSIHSPICFIHEMIMSSLNQDFVIDGIFQFNFW